MYVYVSSSSIPLLRVSSNSDLNLLTGLRGSALSLGSGLGFEDEGSRKQAGQIWINVRKDFMMNRNIVRNYITRVVSKIYL